MATPGRRLRPRGETPLPAVASRSSNAYGTQGKASLHTQVTTTATEFDNAFETAQRRRSTSAASRATRRSTRKSKSVASDKITEESQIAEQDDVTTADPIFATQFHDQSDSFEERPGTAIQTSAVYGANPIPRAQHVPIEEREDPGGDNYEPGRIQLFLRTLPRYLPRLLQDANSSSKGIVVALMIQFVFLLGAFVFIFSLITYTPLPGSLAVRRNALVRGTNVFFGLSYDRPPDEWERNWYEFLHEKLWARDIVDENGTVDQYKVNAHLLARIEKLESRLVELGDQITLHHETLNTLQEILPSSIAVRNINGKWEIESHFWDALADRLSQGESATLWQAFLRANEERLTALSGEATGEALDKAFQDGSILSAASFARTIDENFQWLRSKYQDDFKAMQDSHIDVIQTIANQTALDVFNRNPLSSYAKSQLETLVKANQIHSAYEALRAPNYFSVGMGARIDHRLTSPTMQLTPHTLVQRMWTLFSPVQYDKHPPIAALQRWEEATDCWCSSSTNVETGKAQLTVVMPVQIYPDMLVVEHVPGTSTLDIASAPRELEIWAELVSAKHAQQMVADMTEQVPFYQERSSKCGVPPAPNYVCIGKALYDIHSHKYVQSFPLWADAPKVNLLTKKITVRVTENWGAQWTCLYRLRMTGMRPPQDPEDAVATPALF